MITIGILGIQGAIEEHESALLRTSQSLGLDINVVKLVLPSDLIDVDGIIMPGGESTAMVLIGEKTGMLGAVRDAISEGIPVFGTCAGAILLSKTVRRNENTASKAGAFPFMNTEILRNGYGRQRESFSINLTINSFDEPFNGIFIRAPIIASIGNDVEILSVLLGKPVLVRQLNLLVSTFHPELTEDGRIHEYFINMITNSIEK